MSATTADQIQEVQNALLALADAYKDVDDALSEDGYTALLYSVQPQNIGASASPTQSDEFDPQLLEDGEILEDDDQIVGEDGLVEAAGASTECDRRDDNAAAIGDVLPAPNPNEPTCDSLRENDETELSALRQRTQELTEQLATLVSVKNTQTSELEELKAQFAALTAAHATIVSENNSMRQHHFAVVQYKTRAIEALVAAGSKLKLELNTLSGRLQEAETITKSIEGLVSHYGSLDMPLKLALLEKELSEGQIVKTQVQALHASNQDYAEQTRKMQADLSTLSEEKRRAEAELQRLKSGAVSSPADIRKSQEVPPRPPLGNSNTPNITRPLSQSAGGKENNQPQASKTFASGVTAQNVAPSVTRSTLPRSFFARASETTLASLPEPARTRMWQDTLLVGRPGHLIPRRLIYAAYLGDCKRLGGACPTDFNTFFEMVRYEYFGAATISYGPEFCLYGVALRDVDESEMMGGGPTLPQQRPAQAQAAAPIAPFISTLPRRAVTLANVTNSSRPTSRTSRPLAPPLNLDYVYDRSEASSSAPPSAKRKQVDSLVLERLPKRHRSDPIAISIPSSPRSASTSCAPPHLPTSPPPAIEVLPSSSPPPFRSSSPIIESPSSPLISYAPDPEHSRMAPWDADSDASFALWLRQNALRSVPSPYAALAQLDKLGWAAADGRGFTVPHSSTYFRNARFTMKTITQALAH